MTDTPTRVGPSDAKDAALALLLLPLLGALPLVAFQAGGAIAEAAGSDTGGDFLCAVLSAVVIGWGAPVAVAVRSGRDGYQWLPLSALVAPFALPVLLCLGALR
ncbi:hypothetical protein ATKI12_2449 [Kitasatospora sp. Ki12]|uniref:hypothetical protein n=1 Tax=Kitasatospora xanthocidica TaxID=83382 RepID=UPI0016754E26|nr:hypothetical protein [Kitasatospora xanthocidica]GHF48593.1 hypothetical protein GCM10018790_27900 [Kitasatospora xanthocidica]